MSSLWYYLFPWRHMLRLLGLNDSGEGDYEQVLQSLTDKIEQVQSRLARVRQRERRARVTIPLFAMLFWLVYTVVVWYLDLISWDQMGQALVLPIQLVLGQGLDGQAVWGVPTLLIPLLVACSRTPVQWWYGRVHAAEEKHLAALVRKRRGKVEEIKRVTRYDHLRTLLDRYDDTRPAKTPTDPGRKSAPTVSDAQGAQGSQGAQSTKQGKAPEGAPVPAPAPAPKDTKDFAAPRKGRQSMPALHDPSPNLLVPPVPSLPSNLQRNAQGVRSVSTHQPLNTRSVSAGSQPPSHVRSSPYEAVGAIRSGQVPIPYPPPVAPPPQRTLLDKLADTILGPDPALRVPGPEQRYALICRKCHHHNGLAFKEDWEEIGTYFFCFCLPGLALIELEAELMIWLTEYICPHCGEVNSNRPSTVPVSWPTMPLTPKKSFRNLAAASKSATAEPEVGKDVPTGEAVAEADKDAPAPTNGPPDLEGADNSSTTVQEKVPSSPTDDGTVPAGGEHTGTASSESIAEVNPTGTSTSVEHDAHSARQRLMNQGEDLEGVETTAAAPVHAPAQPVPVTE